MKRLPFFVVINFLLSCVLTSSGGFAQSPFNYGKNKNVYFISNDEREKLRINSICEVYWQNEDFTYQFTAWKFRANEISSTDFVLETNQKVKFNFDSMLMVADEFRNYFHYVLKNGKLSEY